MAPSGVQKERLQPEDMYLLDGHELDDPALHVDRRFGDPHRSHQRARGRRQAGSSSPSDPSHFRLNSPVSPFGLISPAI